MEQIFVCYLWTHMLIYWCCILFPLANIDFNQQRVVCCIHVPGPQWCLYCPGNMGTIYFLFCPPCYVVWLTELGSGLCSSSWPCLLTNAKVRLKVITAIINLFFNSLEVKMCFPHVLLWINMTVLFNDCICIMVA